MVSIFFYFHPYLGEDFQFDEHIFQIGWFNHQVGVGEALLSLPGLVYPYVLTKRSNISQAAPIPSGPYSLIVSRLQDMLLPVQGGPLPVINGVIAPISRVIIPVIHL